MLVNYSSTFLKGALAYTQSTWIYLVLSYLIADRPSTMTDTAIPIELPVIDISDPHDPAVGKAMLDAAAKYGFLYVNSKGTDFATEDVDRGFELVCIPSMTLVYYDKLTVCTVEKVLCVACGREGDLPHYAQRR